MIQYILEVISFQLVFLIIYDFWLKRETFFQWNRVYLIGTYVLSMVLPWVKIEALKTAVPQEYYVYPEFLWNSNDVALTAVAETESAGISISWEYLLLYGGMFLASLFFANKLRQLYLLKRKGKVQRFSDFTQIIIANSQVAFSFFKSIFLGDKVLEGDYKNVIAHELVHIRQRHTYDLLFFEVMRIVCWFNPLVYVYQSRVAELHEFIADAQVAKNNKQEHYQLLLSQAFETQHISFINQFFKSSLIKKRIVMLQKVQSKKVLQLKYLLLVPMVLGMLFYTSCEYETNQDFIENSEISVSDVENLTAEEEKALLEKLLKFSFDQPQPNVILKDDKTTIIFNQADKGNFISGPNGELIQAEMTIDSKIIDEDFSLFQSRTNELRNKFEGDLIAFGKIDEVPIFPGCEDAGDKRACFNEMMQKHISKNFRYPLEAQNMGVQGRVNSMFVITKEGVIRGLRMRGPDKLLEAEVSRILSRLPKMSPGKQGGETVNVPYSIPITFKLQESNFIGTASEETAYEKVKRAQLAEMPNDISAKFQNAIPFENVAQAPIFPGCEDASDVRKCFVEKIQKHIMKNFNYPEVAQESGIQGRVNIMFLIAKDGSISAIAKMGPDKILEDEAVRIISKLPKMKPGKLANGEPVEVPFSIPITFKLDDSEQILTMAFRSDNDDEKNFDEQLFGLKNQIEETLHDVSSEIIGVPFAVVEEAPVFPGCEEASDKQSCFREAIQKHIAKNFRYPREAHKKGIQGSVNTMFFISEDGAIQNIRLLGPHELLEKEAQRILELLPKMKPGKHKGEFVRVPFSIPITFKLK